MSKHSSLRPDLTVVKLADGAKDNWTSLENLDLGLEPDTLVNEFLIVDFFHAAEHLKRACDAIWGKATVKSKAEFERLRILLKDHDNGVDKIIRSLRYRLGRATKHKKKRIQTELTYFRNQRKRMRYADYLRLNLPIASGVVEAACKTLVTQRMKCSGMAWSHAWRSSHSLPAQLGAKSTLACRVGSYPTGIPQICHHFPDKPSQLHRDYPCMNAIFLETHPYAFGACHTARSAVADCVPARPTADDRDPLAPSSRNCPGSKAYLDQDATTGD